MNVMSPFRRKVVLLSALVAICEALVSCGHQSENSISKLDHLTVLGAVSYPSSLQNPPAGTVNIQLDPYISDIGGSGSVVLTIQSCVDPGQKPGVDDDCSKVAGASAPQTFTIPAAVSATVGIFGNPERTGRSLTGPVTVPLQIPPNFLASYPVRDQFNGVPFLISMVATSTSGAARYSQRIFISSQAPNLNPTLRDMLANNVSMASMPSSNVNLSILASTPESYQYMNTDGTVETRTEVYDVTWFVSDGTMSLPHTQGAATTEWRVPNERPKDRDVVLVGVLRDARGGMSILVKRL